MYHRRMVPDSFSPPERAQFSGFHLRMLTVHDVARDFAAVMEAGSRLFGVLEAASRWPEGLTIEENLIDLAWHQREFTIGHSFAYTVMSDAGSRCLGCCYINPSDRAEYDAVALYWAREAGFDPALGAAFRAFVAGWPFRAVGFPGRDVAWADW